MAEEDFRSAVEDGLRLSKRIYFGNERTPPNPPPAMERSAAAASHLPTSPMLYAVVSNPEIVDNPDMPSYQPYVHGKLDPPALMPLQMNRISLDVHSYLDTAFITAVGSWRVHCVMGSRSCDCRLAIPMGEQGSIIGVEVEVPMKSYSTKFAADDGAQSDAHSKKHKDKAAAKIQQEPYLTPHILTFTIPKIDGGTNLNVKLKWSQKLIYRNGQFTLRIPFTFPEYVTPAVKKIAKHESIQINVTPGPGAEILCSSSSHPVKEKSRKSGRQVFLYDADVLSWSSNDFAFSYGISSSNNFGTVFLSPPSSNDSDGKGMFYCYLFPGTKQSEKVFKREVLFVVDISESMKGKLIHDTKNAVSAAISKLSPSDSFNVIAFNNQTYLLSPSLRAATASCIDEATEWINTHFVADGGTSTLQPLSQGMKMFSDTAGSMPLLFLITDGSIEDEKQICESTKQHLANHKNAIPRIHTLGIGSFCNRYFLRKLALLGGGYHDAVHCAVDSIEGKMAALFNRGSSICLADIGFENLKEIDDVEVFPSRIPDLSSGSPLIVSGRYRGTFPQTLKVKGTLPDKSSITEELKVQEAEEEMLPIRKILANQEIQLLTAEAWYSDSEDLKKKITDMSIQNALVSEYTNIIVLETIRKKSKADKNTAPNKQKVSSKVVDSHGVEEQKPQMILVLRNIGIGFGNLHATAENISTGLDDHSEDSEAAKLLRCKCCGWLFDCCCCMSCIQVCSKMNDQLAIALAQLCCGFTCWGCFECTDECCGGCCGIIEQAG